MAARSHRRRSRSLLPIAVALALLAPACGSDEAASPATDAAPASPGTVAAAPATTAPAVEGDAAPATPATEAPATAATEAPAVTSAPIELLSFTAPLVGGGTFDGATYAADRPLALWFWAPT